MKQLNFRPGRREFLRASGALGLAGSAPLLLSSCLGGGNDERPADKSFSLNDAREASTLHFDLSLAAITAPRLHVHRSRHHKAPLVEHTPETRALAKATLPALAAIDDARLTHYVADVDLPAEALQTVWVTGQDPVTGAAALASAMIWVPSSAQAVVLQRRAAAAADRGPSAKALSYGLRTPTQADYKDDGLKNLATAFDIATMLVFHHPEVMNLKPDLGADIIDRIQNRPCNTTNPDPSCTAYIDELGIAIARKIGVQRYPTTQPGSWATLVPMVDADGKPSIDEDGQPRYRYDLDDSVAEALGDVVKQVLLDIFDDPLFKGSNWHATDSLAQVQVQVPPAPTAVAAAVAQAFSLVASRPVGSSFDGIRMVGLEIADADKRSVKLTIKNDYVRYLSVFVQYVDGKGNPLLLASADPDVDTPRSAFVKLVSANSQLMGIPFQGGDVSDNNFTVTMPPDAAEAHVMFGSLGLGGDAFAPEAVAGSCMTLAFNIGLPTLFLAEGIYATVGGGLKAFFENYEVVKGLMKACLKLVAKSLPRAGVATYFSASSDSAKPFLLSFAPLALSILLTSLPAVAEIIGVLAASGAVLDAVPFVGIAVRVLATVADLAAILVSVGEVLASAAISTNVLTLPYASTVRLRPDPMKDYEFPATATNYVVDCVYSTGAAPKRFVGALSAGTTGPIDAVFPAVVSGGKVTVTVALYSYSGCLVGYAKSDQIDNLPSAATTIDLTITEKLVALNAQTRYLHDQNLVYASAQRVWQAGPAATGTLAQLCGGADNAICQLNGITVHTPTGNVGYAYQAGGQNLPQCGGTGASQAALNMLQNEFGGTAADAAFQLSPCGATQPIGIVYDTHGARDSTHHYFLQQDETGYHLRSIDLLSKTPFDYNQKTSWGRFTLPLDSLAVLPTGYVVGVNRLNHKMAIMTLPDKPYDTASEQATPERVAHLKCGRGVEVGRLESPVAVAYSRGAVLVLEQGNARVQAMNQESHAVFLFKDAAGTPTSLFDLTGPDPQNPETKDSGVDFLDLATEGAGYMYVLSCLNGGAAVDDFRIDIYTPDGVFLNRTTGIACARIAVDTFRVLYTLNTTPLGNPNRVEPSLSKWIPSEDAGCAKTPPSAGLLGTPGCAALVLA